MSKYKIIFSKDGKDISIADYETDDQYDYGWYITSLARDLFAYYMDKVFYKNESSSCDISVRVEKVVS